MSKSVQDSLIEAIDIIVDEKVDKVEYTKSNTGLVISVNSSECVVRMQENDYTCIIMEHLEDWIQEDDIVIVQDLYNNGQKRAVIGKIGTTRNTSFTVYDTSRSRAISGVEDLYDEETSSTVNTILEVE